VLGSETDQRLQEVAMQVLGAYGTVYDDRLAGAAEAIAREYMYSRSETIMGGTSEIQRNVIAQRILGLPR
jgi:alkylation response protein AidB-like acyl-CoA dehydrogenase